MRVDMKRKDPMTTITIDGPGRGFGPRERLLFMHGRRRHRHGFGGAEHWRGFGPGPFGGRRAGRGDIRAAILALLAEQPMHGYQIIREIGERSEGAWTPSPGSVYPTLQQLTDEGLVRSSETDGKRVYELTDEGRAQAEGRTGSLPWEEAAEDADGDLVALRDLVFQVMAATRQVAHAGSKEQLAAAQEILRGARKGLYRLLAEDDAGEASGDT
jgi:DNA-binding PadR family transcriptional regulator